jgi:hypothetical protein
MFLSVHGVVVYYLLLLIIADELKEGVREEEGR